MYSILIYSINIYDHYKLLEWSRWIFNQINMKQTFIMYLPCARLWMIYTKKKDMVPALLELTVYLSWQTTTNTMAKHQGGIVKKGLVLPGERRAGFTEMETMELGLGWEGVHQMEGKGGSAFQAEETAHEQADSWKHMPWCRMTSEQSSAARA